MCEFKRKNGYMFIKLQQDLVIGENDEFEVNVLNCLTPDIKGFIVDIDNTKYIDSSGLSILLRIRKLLFDKAKNLYIIVNNPKLIKVFKTARMDKDLIIVKNIEEIFDESFIEKDENFENPEIMEFKVVIPADFSYIKVAQDFVMRIVKNNYDYTKTDEYDILMSLEETLSNSIEHGYVDSRKNAKIRILVLSIHSEIIIFIDDYGKGYNSEKILEKVNNSFENPYNTRGRGFLILKGITDDFHYDSMKDKVSSVIIVKKLNNKE